MFLVFLVSFRAHRTLEPSPDWSPLGVRFKISDEHPRLFYMGVPPPPPPPPPGLFCGMTIFYDWQGYVALMQRAYLQSTLSHMHTVRNHPSCPS